MNPSNPPDRSNFKKKINFLKKTITWLLIFLIFGYLVSQVYFNWTTVEEAIFKARFNYIIISLTFIFLNTFWSFKIWQLILRDLAEKLTYYQCMRICSYANLGRYMPGKVWMVMGKIYLCEKEGIPIIKAGCSIYIELITTIIASVILSYIAILQYIPFAFLQTPFLAVGFFAILCALLHPKVLEKSINLGFKMIKRPKKVFIPFSFLTILKFIVLYEIAWLLNGISLYFLVSSLHIVSNHNIFVFSGFIAAAWVMGLISIFSPSGLGVREGVLTYLLSHLVPTPIAVAVSLLSRFLFTIAEMGIAGLSFFLSSSIHPQKNKFGDKNYEKVV